MLVLSDNNGVSAITPINLSEDEAESHRYEADGRASLWHKISGGMSSSITSTRFGLNLKFSGGSENQIELQVSEHDINMASN